MSVDSTPCGEYKRKERREVSLAYLVVALLRVK